MRRWWALVACSGLGVGVAACSSAPPAPPTAAPTGCHGTPATGRLVLADTTPVPMVRAVPGTCIEVSVPRSGFPGKRTEVPRVTPGGRLHLVSDTLLADGGRTAYYSAVRPGTATISSTVDVQTNQAVPEWSGLVVVG
jgi:hypothetical protein